MSKIKNGGLDQYGAEPFEQQQFGTAGNVYKKCNVALQKAATLVGRSQTLHVREMSWSAISSPAFSCPSISVIT